MPSTGAKKHIHRYHKIGNRWYCSLSDCTHFWPQSGNEALLGKKSKCWNCGKEFILDDETMKRDKPVCLNCLLNDDAASIIKNSLIERGI